jgi:hypothetical protein
MRLGVPGFVVLVALLAGCGGVTLPTRAMSASQALTGAPELMDFESPSTRQELFREVARASQLQASNAGGLVLFPVLRDGEITAAPGFDARADLLQTPDAGSRLTLSFDGRGQRWSEERRESLQGLSEREVVELVSRTLLAHWGIAPEGPVEVERAVGAPYAAAYMDGMLRVNPAFLYMAAAPASPQ